MRRADKMKDKKLCRKSQKLCLPSKNLYNICILCISQQALYKTMLSYVERLRLAGSGLGTSASIVLDNGYKINSINKDELLPLLGEI